MPRLTFRTWYVLGLLGTVLLVAQLMRDLSAVRMQQPANTAEVHAAATAISRGNPYWGDPAWQRSITARLGTLQVDAIITNGTGQIIYRHDTGLVSRSPSATYTVVTSSGLLMGTVSIYRDSSGTVDARTNLILAIAGLLVLALLLGGGWFVGRMVLHPLAVMSKAARRIVDGDLYVEIPSSRVREVGEVGAAFMDMASGLRIARERQTALEQERTLLITAIAHDLRTPLFALRSRLEGLERGLATTPEKAATYIRVAREKADALERLIADLFAYTRLEYLEQSIQEEDVDIGLLLEQAVESARPQAETKGVALTLDGDQEPAFVRGDAHLLTRAVGNVLDNAVRYTPAGGQIELRWRASDDRVILEVADSGPGIAPDDLPHLFEPLYRADTSRNTQTGGVGLGLTIARRIIRAHGGELGAANRPGGGAIFIGTLAGADRLPIPSPHEAVADVRR